MANPGGGGKFVSVNLNKSYGQTSSSYANASRARSGHHSGGSGMVVLSRPRSSGLGSTKAGPRLSVPPPMNLPSLRKEHERHDQSLGPGAAAGARNAGLVSSHASSVVGWTKLGLSTTTLVKNVGQESSSIRSQASVIEKGSSSTEIVKGDNEIYLPPARSATSKQHFFEGSNRVAGSVEKVVVLRGEDFPTLNAAIPSATVPVQKHKDVHLQKQKPYEEGPSEHSASSSLQGALQTRPQISSSRLLVGGVSSSGEITRSNRLPNRLNENGQSRNLDRHLSGPLPIVHLHHTDDWEDDERDTARCSFNRDRDSGLTKNGINRGKDFEIPRSGFLQTMVHDVSDRRVNGDAAHTKALSGEVLRGDMNGRGVINPTRDVLDVSSWRASPSFVKDGFAKTNKNGMGRSFSPSREVAKEINYDEPTINRNGGEIGFSNTSSASQDFRHLERDSGSVASGQNGDRFIQAFSSKITERSIPNKYASDNFRSSSMGKPLHSLGNKSRPHKNPTLNFGWEKRWLANGGKAYTEVDFDRRDPFGGGFIGESKLFKRKKDAMKKADFYDPVRESFEAELEKVQKMQEQERQRVAAEQARALELARKEEEERQRLAQEEEERRRWLEEEAREAAWRAEVERLEALKRIEQQKMAREEEKKRLQLEEERRKEAARQKLLELEARIAKREAEGNKDDKFTSIVKNGNVLGILKGQDVPKATNVGETEGIEGIVERTTSSTMTNFSTLARDSVGSRSQSSRDGSSIISDGGKRSNLWSGDLCNSRSSSSFSQQDQENGYFRSSSSFPQHDQEHGYFTRREGGLGPGRVYSGKDFNEGSGGISGKASYIPETPLFDDYSHRRGQRWNGGGEVNQYNKNAEFDLEFLDSSDDKLGGISWEQTTQHGNLNGPYADRLFKDSDVDAFSTFGRSRYSIRQPRVLPPPSLPAMRTSRNDSPNLSAFQKEATNYSYNIKDNEHNTLDGYETGDQNTIGLNGIFVPAEKNVVNVDEDGKPLSRCDSQSTLSVSSPPDSPTHISHEDLDDTGEFDILPHVADVKETDLSEKEHLMQVVVTGEDEKWNVEVENEELCEQEEYDEEGETYHEDDEVHEGDVDNLDLAHNYDGYYSKEQNNSGTFAQLVVGFHEGVDSEAEICNAHDLEIVSRSADKAIERLSTSSSHAPAGVVEVGQNHFAKNDLSVMSTESFSRTDETEKALRSLPTQSPVSSPTYLLDLEIPVSSVSAGQLPGTPATNMSSQPPIPVLHPDSSIPSQSESLPVKLHFGLFSGQSVIPSPVPGIQIGSIQMPLLHPQVRPSLNKFHPSQSPLFQFGQFSYTSPMSDVQPAVSTCFSSNQDGGPSVLNQGCSVSSTQNPHLNKSASLIDFDDGQYLVPKLASPSMESTSKESKTLFQEASDYEVLPSQSHVDSSLFAETVSEAASQVQGKGQNENNAVDKNFRSIYGDKAAEGQRHVEITPSQVLSSGRNFGGSKKAPGSASGHRGKRFIYAVRNNSLRSYIPASEAPTVVSNSFQTRARRNIRSEFRVRENVNRQPTESFSSSIDLKVNDRSNASGRLHRTSLKGDNNKDTLLNESTKPLLESEVCLSSESLISHADNENKMSKTIEQDLTSKPLKSTLKTKCSAEVIHSTSIVSKDADAPLQSGIVSVFKQSGIEAPSDEDDFIKVRSKRQMLIDRREQRQKEIKAKSRAIKASRKPHTMSQTASMTVKSNRITTTASEEMQNGSRSECTASDVWMSTKDEVSVGFTSGVGSPPLAPIGTPASTDSIIERSHVTKIVSLSSVSASCVGANVVPGLPMEKRSASLDNEINPFGPWTNSCINPQVMSATHIQPDEALSRRPAHFGACNSLGGKELGKSSSPLQTPDKSFSSTASPLTSLLAGEKIQFGAVTSPTILPPSSVCVSSCIRPRSCRTDVSLDCSTSASVAECSIVYEIDKQPNFSCVRVEDHEAKVESAVTAAVEASSSNALVASSVSSSGAMKFEGPDISGPSSECAMTGDQKISGISGAEESLTVALPADLSVETPPLSLWPPLPSPSNSSAPILPHFPCAPPPFSCYDMNPMLGGQYVAFNPHDESAGTQPPSQNSGTATGVWQPCPSGVDSFYGPSGGLTGPFMNPGGIPAVQGSPHMVVYNHFAPVGQLGLSFMGTTYIPSGKQPDWKHTPSAVVCDGDIHSSNVSSAQINPSIMPPIQHLAPGSPLLPMPSPFTMFDLSRFQSPPDIAGQARWTHMPSSPLHSAGPSVSLMQQRVEGVPASQFSHGLSADAQGAKNCRESCSSSDTCKVFPPAIAVTQFPCEVLVKPAFSAHVQTSNAESILNPSKGTASDAGQRSTGAVSTSGAALGRSRSASSSALGVSVNQQPNSSAPHFVNSVEHRGGGVLQKIDTGGEWHRRAGYPGRNHFFGSDKKPTLSKVKQVYVAKLSTSAPATSV